MNPKYLILILPMLITATSAMADLELTVDIEYPRVLELKIPVQEDSDFEMHTSFSHGEFFTATGHVGRITGLNTNRSISLTYGYEYNLANGKGSATDSGSQGLNDKYSLRIVTSTLSANPRFTIHEVRHLFLHTSDSQIWCSSQTDSQIWCSSQTSLVQFSRMQPRIPHNHRVRLNVGSGESQKSLIEMSPLIQLKMNMDAWNFSSNTEGKTIQKRFSKNSNANEPAPEFNRRKQR